MVLMLSQLAPIQAAGDKMPVPSVGYVQAAEVEGLCSNPKVTGRGYETADGASVTDEYYPMLAWFLDGRDTPFFAIRYVSKTGIMVEFWLDEDGDGVADERGDRNALNVLMSNYDNNLCKLAQEVE